MDWPDYLQVWPAHVAGSACGKALGSVPQSTVGYEKMFNASIRAAESENGFVNFILEGQPEPPLYFARMKHENKAGPRVLGGLPRPKSMSAAEMLKIDGRNAALADLRPWASFRAGHLPGSISLPLNNSFSTDAGSLIAADEPIYLIVEPQRLDEAIRDLIRVGLDDIMGWFDAGRYAEIEAAGGRLESTREVLVDQARQIVQAGEVTVLDTRRKAEFVEGHIPGAINIAHTRLLSRLAEIPKNRPILVNCQGGSRSARACSILQKQGFDATNLAGGIAAWEAAKGPIER